VPDCKTLLLVEDEALIALAEQRSLQREGYRVVHVSTGEDAVRYVENECSHDRGHVDLVLMDIDLGPGIDGTEAARRILERRNVPLVFLSSHTEKEYTDRAERITSYGYIVKNSGDRVLFASIKMAFKLFEAHSALRESEERFRLLAENAEDLIYRMEFVPERRFTYVSPAATKMTGYTPEEHYADCDLGFKLVHPDDRERLLEMMDSGNGFGAPVVLRWCRKDGTVIWTEQNNVPIYDEDGTLIAVEGIARDVTERRRMEESLKQSNRRLSEFLQISKSVTAAEHSAALLQKIVDSATAVTHVDSGAVYLMHKGSTIRLAATTPPLPEDFSEQLRIADLREHPHVRRAIESGESIVMPDTETAALTPAEQEIVRLRNLRSCLYLPIRLRETALGVLILGSMGEPHTFDDEEVLLLHGFADQAARLIENTRKYEAAMGRPSGSRPEKFN